MRDPIGIERIAAFPCTLSMDMATLVAARDGRVEDVCGEMMITERSLNPAWEDPVTMAVNAAKGMVTDQTRDTIRLLVVASESGLDQEKALSTWVHRHLGLRDDCRNFEVKHACYAGTSALRLAAAMVLADPDPDARALVIATDQSRMHFNQPYEFVMGAGAVAFIVSRTPDFFALDHDLGGVYTHEVPDLIRPTSRVEAGHSETSLLSYLDAADITFDRYRKALATRYGVEIDGMEALANWFNAQVYHAPFGGITKRAHKAVLRLMQDYDRGLVAADFETRVAPSLIFNQRMGGTYAASVFISLIAAADAFGAGGAGQRCGVYSYGSGSCAEFYSGTFGPEAARGTAGSQLQSALDARKQLSVAEYEEAEMSRAIQIDAGDFVVSTSGLSAWYEHRYAGQGLLCLQSVSEHVRDYGWS